MEESYLDQLKKEDKLTQYEIEFHLATKKQARLIIKVICGIADIKVYDNNLEPMAYFTANQYNVWLDDSREQPQTDKMFVKITLREMRRFHLQFLNKSYSTFKQDYLNHLHTQGLADLGEQVEISQ